jgi:cytidyltransferase-like protein
MKQYSFTIGRFQPLHQGHIKLIRSVLNEGKNVCVALRDTIISDSDPYSVDERIAMFNKEFWREIEQGKMKVIVIPDVSEVFYGRKVGWGVREIHLDEKTESISATKIRAGIINNNGDTLVDRK